jgi:putative NADH-flavin reductase
LKQGSGNLGSVILKELLKSGLFEITVLTRESSTHKFPEEVNIVRVDYTNLESLTKALEGQDALVSTVAPLAVPSQRMLIDAAVKSSVKRIIPSE